MNIRLARTQDLPLIVEMAERFLLETPYREFYKDRAQLERVVGLVLDHGIGFVADVEEQPVGMIGAIVMPHPLAGALYADEVVWYVAPEHRHGRAGPLLLGALEDWATRNGCTSVKMIAPIGTDVGRFYERRGYRAIETAWLKGL